MDQEFSMIASEERTARFARQGAQTALRIFCEIRVRSASAAEAREAVAHALALVDQGPAPQPFKDAARKELCERLTHHFPSARDDLASRDVA
jgi:hypothetical protein